MDEELGGEQSQESIGQTVDTAKNIGGKVATGAKKVANGVKNTAKVAAKVASKTGQAAAKTASMSLLANPVFWKVVLVVVIVLVIVFVVVLFVAGIISAVVFYFTKSDYDPKNGTLSSVYGIYGDNFYGARFVYKDDNAASLEIQENYLKLTYNLLNDTKNQIGLNISLSADYASDENILEITTDYANALVKNENAELTIVQCANIIDHFGFTDEEIVIVFDSIANTISENSWASSNKTNIKATLQNQFKDEKFSSYKNVTPKIYVWDYILDGKDDSLKKLPRKDYYGFIFMPKQDTKMTFASFIFVVDQGYGVDVCLKHKTSEQSEPTALGDVVNANVTWFDNQHTQKFYECDFDANLNTFEAIDSNNTKALTTPTSIYTMLGNGIYSNYFNETENYDGLTLIENVATTNYIYLELNNKDEDRSPFNFAEQIVEYS